MANMSELRQTVADFFDVPESEIAASFSLRRRSDSIARAALDAAIRHRVGLVARSVYAATTYGEIENELFPDDAAKAPVSAPDVAAPAAKPFQSGPAVDGTVACGIDIELVDNMPKAADYWEAPFYRTNFAPAEIAFCLRQEAPALHLAARWCVKEALKKCDATFLAEEMNNIELVAGESAPPYLMHHVGGQGRRLPHAVSLAHTGSIAVAAVVKVTTTTPAPALSRPAAATTEPAPLPVHPTSSSSAPQLRRLALVCLLVSLAALSVAMFALWRSM